MPVKKTYRAFELILLGICLGSFTRADAQECPPNIDFESGSFNSWTCYTGTVQAQGNLNVINLHASGPLGDQHQIYSAVTHAGIRDPFGEFPVVCPNGSGHSVKLGNTTGGAQAEGLSYDFIIPAGRNTYSLIYNYAVVFQDPNHQEFQQPRLVLEVWNQTDNTLIDCSSFTFFPNGSPLPGFFLSPNADSTAVWCKDWSAVSINLNGMAGKNIRLFFKTADCTFRRHFGYAYIDVNTECSSEFTGATFCPDDTAVMVTGPYGYQQYTWFNESFTQSLGNQQTLILSPPPARGTLVAVELIPYNGYGCLDTLYARLVDTLTLTAVAGPDRVSCNGSSVHLGSNRKPGVMYNWSPATGLSDPTASNPRASPAVTTLYELTVSSPGGGCLNRDTVVVKASFIDSSLQLTGKSLFCITSNDSAVLQVQPTDSVQWYWNNNPVTGASALRYRANQSGHYRAQLYTRDGCTLSTRTENIRIESPRPGIIYPVQYAVLGYPLTLQARDFGVSTSWFPPDNLDNPVLKNPVFTPVSETDKRYGVRITTAAGCVTVDSQWVRVLKEIRILVPSAFTPNNDGRNDYFRPLTEGLKQLHYFRVFNRWGQLVYQFRPGQPGWNGVLNGQPQETGVYVWMLEATGLDNRKYVRKGTVTLIR